MPRTILVFKLSSTQAQTDLLHEFSLHADVHASADSVGGIPVVRVSTSNAASAIWDVRATVGMFDDLAIELRGQE